MIICGEMSFSAKTAVVGGQLHGFVGGDVAEGDVLVLIELRAHCGEPDGRAAGSDLDLDSGGFSTGVEVAAHRLLVGVDHRVRSEQLVEVTVVGLGVPVGLDGDGGRADAGEVDGACCGGRRCAVAGRRAGTAGQGDPCSEHHADGDGGANCCLVHWYSSCAV